MGMSLYQIDERFITILEQGFDPVTGEMLEGYDLEKALDEVSMELDKKIENIGAFYKSLLAYADSIKEEKMNLQQRQKVVENKAERLKNYLDRYMRMVQADYFNDTTGKVKFNKFESPKCTVTYRKSTSVDIKDLNKVPEEYIKPRVIKDTDVDKTKATKYLQTHEDKTIDGLELVENKNISIK